MAGVRKVYGKPWSQLAKGIEMDRKTMMRLGRALVRAVRTEAKLQVARQAGMPGSPEGLPRGSRFIESFGYRIAGKSTVEVTSTWPFIEQLVEGREPYKMTWLTQDRGVGIVPLTQKDGTVIFRVAPKQMSDAWVHPGWARHTFLERGIQKGRIRMAEIIGEEVARQIRVGDPFR